MSYWVGEWVGAWVGCWVGEGVATACVFVFCPWLFVPHARTHARTYARTCATASVCACSLQPAPVYCAMRMRGADEELDV